jgi:CheY-like chemotaxis protein
MARSSFFATRYFSVIARQASLAHSGAATILVAVVDDDESVRDSLPDLLQEFGFSSIAFVSPMEYLESSFIDETRCLISDVAMPGMSGPELRRELVRRGYAIPTILITAHRNVAFRPQVRDGAIASPYQALRGGDIVLRTEESVTLGKDRLGLLNGGTAHEFY